ncbi:hypothetical protein HAZT_HAZT001760 [Hyalella azteca]|uniref:Uncharacterized protein n=1 Tax=Hyalella azteca TaxID=294128 RepID=A0A6A0GQP8_HYAAZ|nr:hypothetical protein HAZT_HAZT001760 [Hyalella azteca]
MMPHRLSFNWAPVPPSCSEAVWDKLFDINVKSTWAITKLVAPYMQKKKNGCIIYVPSLGVYGQIVPDGALSGYIVSKTCLLSLCKMAAQQLAPDNVRVNTIIPGAIKTRFAEVLSREDVASYLMALCPLGRFGEPDDVAGMAAFLASADASYVTGENFVVAGGMPSRL